MKNNTHTHFLPILLIFILIQQAPAKLSVLSPLSLEQQLKSDISYNTARFGVIPYGRSMIISLAFFEGKDSCTGFEINRRDMDPEHLSAVVTPLGNCKPVVKARMAQEAGAKMLILVTSFDDPQKVVIQEYSKTDDINIPVLVLGKVEGQLIIESILEQTEEGRTVTLSANFANRPESHTVQVDLWYSSADTELEIQTFCQNFGNLFTQMDTIIDFNPHPVILNCERCQQNNYTNKDDNCLSGGRYCAPEFGQQMAIPGRQIVYEDIRQQCVFQKFPDQWFNYVKAYSTQCRADKNQEYCVEGILQDLGINAIIVRECIFNSFKKKNGDFDPDISDNVILQSQKNIQNDFSIHQYPLLMINQVPYNGRLSNRNSIKDAICDNLNPKPDFCTSNFQGAMFGNSQTSYSFLTIFFCIAIIMGSILIFVKRRTQNDIKKEVPQNFKTMAQKYIPVATKPMDEEKNLQMRFVEFSLAQQNIL